MKDFLVIYVSLWRLRYRYQVRRMQITYIIFLIFQIHYAEILYSAEEVTQYRYNYYMQKIILKWNKIITVNDKKFLDACFQIANVS